MLAFIVRRLIGMVVVLFVVSFFVFAIFIIVPGGGRLGTAQRIAGKNATPQNVLNIEHRWGFDRPFYVQYGVMMQKMVSGNLVSYTKGQNVVDQIIHLPYRSHVE